MSSDEQEDQLYRLNGIVYYLIKNDMVDEDDWDEAVNKSEPRYRLLDFEDIRNMGYMQDAADSMCSMGGDDE